MLQCDLIITRNKKTGRLAEEKLWWLRVPIFAEKKLPKIVLFGEIFNAQCRAKNPKFLKKKQVSAHRTFEPDVPRVRRAACLN